jgi:hypothetical protein
MIYLFHGTDVDRVRTKAFEWVAKARAKEPNLAYARLAKEELSSAALQDAAASGGLFVQRLLVLLDDPFASARKNDEEGGDTAGDGKGSVVEEHLAMLVDSDNAIIVLAPKLAAAKIKKIATKAKVVYVFDKKESREATRGFNTALVNALAARSRGALWLEVNRALRAGDAPEMLHGLLHWKARDLMAKGARTWKPQEAGALSLQLISLLQESRRGGLELGLALERWALTV